MNDDARLLMRWLRSSETILAGLKVSEDSPFRAATTRIMEAEVAHIKARVFDAMRETIEAMEGGR